MKKVKNLFFLCVIGISIMSCNDQIGLGDDPVEKCDFTQNEKVGFNSAIRLTVQANGMSNNYYNSSGIFVDNFFHDLKTATLKGDTGLSYKGTVTVKLKSSDETCVGENTQTFAANSSSVGGDYIYIKTPSNADFIGEATTIILSDYWKSKNSINNVQFVSWTGIDNNPQGGGLKGSIVGIIKEINPSAGKIVLQGKGSNSYYVKNGNKVYL